MSDRRRTGRWTALAWCATFAGFLAALSLTRFGSPWLLMKISPFDVLVTYAPAALLWGLAGTRWYRALALYVFVVAAGLVGSGLLMPSEAAWSGSTAQTHSVEWIATGIGVYTALLGAVNLIPVALLFAIGRYVSRFTR